MRLAEFIGYIASILVFTTFYMRGMVHLRLTATASNLCFIAYGASFHLLPVLILHIFLLPLNVWRVLELFVVTRSVKSAVDIDICLQTLGPYLRAERYAQGVSLFKKGDSAQCMYLLSEGELIIEEITHILRPTAIFGEMALFLSTERRTFSVRALTNATVFAVSKSDIEMLCLRRPELALYLLRLITGRLVEDLEKLRSMSSETTLPHHACDAAQSSDTGFDRLQASGEGATRASNEHRAFANPLLAEVNQVAAKR